jgi:hypothetical protein
MVTRLDKKAAQIRDKLDGEHIRHRAVVAERPNILVLLSACSLYLVEDIAILMVHNKNMFLEIS